MLTNKIKSNDKKELFKRIKHIWSNFKCFSKSNSLESNASVCSNVKYLIHSILFSHFYIYLYPILFASFTNNLQTLDPTSSDFLKHFHNKLEDKDGVYILVHNIQILGLSIVPDLWPNTWLPFKILNNKTSSIWCSEGENEWLGCHRPLNPSILIVDHT